MRKLIAAAVILALLAGGAAWIATRPAPPAWLPAPVAGWLAGGEEEATGGGPRRRVAVRLAPVETGEAAMRFETSGTVRAADSVTLAAQAPGRVERVFIDDGASLEAGDPILRLDDSAQTTAVSAAQAALAEAEAELARARELAESDYAAEARVETALAAARTARADLEAAREALENRTLAAPFAGRVGFVDVSPGAYLDPGAPVASLQTLDDLRVRFALPLEVARAAEDAARVEVRDGTGPACRSSRIVAVSPLNDPRSRTRRFEAKLPRDCGLRPGAFATVSVVTRAREGALFVPQTAVLRQGFSAVVFRAEETEQGLLARRVSVELGPFEGERIEVRSGLAAGQRVVASGLQKVSDGAPIRPVEAGE